MFTATMGFTMYIGLSLTNLYPLVQSLRDDMAFDAFEVYSNRWGGFELYLFNIGFQFVLFALLVVARVLYSDLVQYILIFIFFCLRSYSWGEGYRALLSFFLRSKIRFRAVPALIW